MRLGLRQLVHELPQRPESDVLTEQRFDPAFSTVVTEVPRYVWPDLTLENDQVEVRPATPVLLVRAPGAMGKSAAARAVASELRCPLVNLAKLRVGSNGLTGLLTRALGWKQAPTFIQDLQAGRAALVLDSTDEAQLAAGQDNYLAFLQDVADLLQGAKGGGQLLIFGRPDAISTTYLGLAECGMQTAIAEVAPLSHGQSCELVDKTLDGKITENGAYTVHRDHPEPFGRLRDTSFLGIAKALQPDVDPDNFWESTEEFLGYPPVLMALAERLAVDNPQAETALVSRTEQTHRRRQGELLREVVEKILDRESAKVRAGVAETLRIPPADPRYGVIYSRDEQCLRVVGRISTAPLTIDAPASLQPVERATYEELVANFTADHPFLRDETFANAVFADYVRAFLATAPLRGVHGVTREALLSVVPQAGPFFAHFVHDLVGGGTEAGAFVTEDLVGDLVVSYAGGASWAHSVFMQNDSKASLTLQAQGGREDVESAEHESLFFHVTDLSGVLTLSSPLARCLIVTDQGLVISGSNGSLSIGPDVGIFAHNIEFLADAVTVSGGGSEGTLHGITMIIAGQASHDARLRVIAHPEPSLRVSWPELWHQWKPYAFEMADYLSDTDPMISSQVLLGLRRILVSFSAATDNDPLVYAEKFERFAIGGNKVFLATSDALQDLGVIERQGAIYRLRLHVLGDFGVVWAKLHGGEVASTLRQLHAEVMKHDALRGMKAP